MFMRSGFGRNDPNFDFAAQHLIFLSAAFLAI